MVREERNGSMFTLRKITFAYCNKSIAAAPNNIALVQVCIIKRLVMHINEGTLHNVCSM